MSRALVALGLLTSLTLGVAACATPDRATPDPARTAQDDCVHAGGVWRASACEQQAGGGGGM